MRPPSFVDDLVRAALDGDRATFDRLYDLAFAAVWRAAARRAPEGAEAAAGDWLRRAFADGLAAARVEPWRKAEGAPVKEHRGQGVGARAPTIGAR